MEVPLRSQARRVLVTSLPWLSHFLAQLPLARAMADAGHEVRFATSVALAPTARRAGFDVVVVPMSRAEATGDELTLSDATASATFGYIRHAASVAPALLREFDRWCPEVVVRDPLELGSCLAAERAGIPHAVGREGPFWTPDQRQGVLAGLADLRRQLRLPPDPEVEAPYRYLAFAFAPPGLLRADAFVPPVMHFIRPSPSDARAGLPDEGWMPPPAGRNLVYATLGTVFNSDAVVLQAMARAFAGQPYDALLTIGPDQDVKDFAWSNGVANLTVRRYVPQTSVLPRSDLMVSHGGFGTVIGALLHGVPMVLLPMAGDQHRNARWCAAAGAAVVLDQHSRGPLPIQKAVAKVLSDPSYRSAAGGLRDEMAGLPDISAAVAMVAQLAAERVPMTRTA